MLNSLILLAQLGPTQLGPDKSPLRRVAPIAREAGTVAKKAAGALEPAQVAQAADAAGSGDLTQLFLYLTVFMLAVFVGVEIITKVPPTLHTPLMSGSNAISGITLIGAMAMAGSGQGHLASLLGLLAIVCATMNVVGGFLVTHRMLEMFQKKK